MRQAQGAQGGDRVRGETAFTLYDTYGFPLDLTQDALRASGHVDTDAFNAAMERQRKRRANPGKAPANSRPRRSGSRSEKPGATEFLGYETESAEGVVAALVKDGKDVASLKKGESGIYKVQMVYKDSKFTVIMEPKIDYPVLTHVSTNLIFPSMKATSNFEIHY